MVIDENGMQSDESNEYIWKFGIKLSPINFSFSQFQLLSNGTEQYELSNARSHQHAFAPYLHRVSKRFLTVDAMTSLTSSTTLQTNICFHVTLIQSSAIFFIEF